MMDDSGHAAAHGSELSTSSSRSDGRGSSPRSFVLGGSSAALPGAAYAGIEVVTR